MELNDLLKGKGIDPRNVLVLRHRPNERELRKVLPWLAAEEPEVFNAYQLTQAIPAISDLLYCSVSLRTWTLATLSGWKVLGSNDSTPARRSA